jgi:protein O-mannosyl-transferase
MGLNSNQKNYIKKNLRHLTAAQIAGSLGISEQEVLEYLRGKWSKEKYNKFIRNRVAANSSQQRTEGFFSFTKFILENRISLATLVILVFAVYANSFGNGFVSDDVAGFLRNENIGKFSSVFNGPMHFSLSAFFQFFAFHIGGLHPFAFRIINILSHLGCVILIYTLIALSMKKQIAFIAAALFAVHPLLTESVSWISGGLYSLYAFFFLLSFLYYLFSKNNQKYFYYSVAFFILALFSSEKAIVLFLVFPLYEFALGDLKLNWKKALPYFAVGVVMALLFVTKIGTRVSDVESMSYQQGGGGLYNPLMQIPVAIGSYIGLMFWPAKLTLYHTEMSFGRGIFSLMVVTVLVYLGLLIYTYRKNRVVFFWLLFFVVTLLPTLTPFKISWIVAERYVYLGTLGIIIPVAMLFDKLLETNENGKMVGYFALILIVASLSVRTIIRNRDWQSEDTLWIATGQVAPSGQNIHNNLGDVYARQKNYPKAIEEFQKATQINPNYADAYHNLANTYQQVGQLDLAETNYQKALSINPKLWQSFENLAAIYFNQGDFQKAHDYMEKALEINPNDNNLKQSVQVIESKLQGQ